MSDLVMDGNSQDEVMNIQEAAAFLRCSVSCMYRDTAIGAIPCVKKGRRVLFLRSQLLEWLKLQSVYPANYVVNK